MPTKFETRSKSAPKNPTKLLANEKLINTDAKTNGRSPLVYKQQLRRSTRISKNVGSPRSDQQRSTSKRSLSNRKKVQGKAKRPIKKQEELDIEAEKPMKEKRKSIAVTEKTVISESVKQTTKKNGARKTEIEKTMTESITVEKILSREFYTRDAVTVAKDLLGKIIVRRVGDKVIKCKIVETEAYAGATDKASLAYENKLTDRTKPMFREGGHVFVYPIYGINYCFNITTSDEGDPSTAFLRAVEVIEGLDTVIENRKSVKTSQTGKELTNGPGKLSAALKIDKALQGHDVTKVGELYLIDGSESFEVVTAKRININYAKEFVHKPWRFCIKNSIYVSVKADSLE